MAKAEPKTKPTKVDPRAFVEAVEHKTRREDGLVLLDFFDRITGLKPVMWGPSLIGYGRYKYEYESGHSGEMLLTGFSPRKASQSLYVMPGYRFGDMQEKLSRLGKHKLGKACLYVNKLADIDIEVLEEIVRDGLDYMYANYKTFEV